MSGKALHDEAHSAAIQAAFALPAVPLPHTPPQKPPRTRFMVGGRIVDLIELPFGIALWNSFDPSVNAVTKSLMQRVGGRWQPRFKNWLAPIEAKDYVLSELTKLSSAPPTRRG
jgi:hypothetical protein